MDYHETFFKAQLMDKNRLAAARIRARFLMDEIDDWLEIGDDVSKYYAFKCYEEIIYLFRNAGFSFEKKNNLNNDVTQEQIEQARRYPVDKLIKFKHGKATAWCHDDRSPTLFHGTRKNIAVCPACNLKFGPIDIIMEQKGYSFYDAVRYLT